MAVCYGLGTVNISKSTKSIIEEKHQLNALAADVSVGFLKSVSKRGENNEICEARCGTLLVSINGMFHWD